MPAPLRHLQPKVDSLLKSHSDLGSFMTTYNPDLQSTCAKHEDRSYFGNAPILVVLNYAYSETAAEQWLVPQLIDLCAYCGVREKLNERQMRQLAGVIVSEYGYLKTTELMLFFHRFKAGQYGLFYGSIDPLVIMQALEKFCKERRVAVEHHEREQERMREEQERATRATFSPQEFCRSVGLPEGSSVIEVMRMRDRIINFIEGVVWCINLMWALVNAPKSYAHPR